MPLHIEFLAQDVHKAYIFSPHPAIKRLATGCNLMLISSEIAAMPVIRAAGYLVFDVPEAFSWARRQQ